MSKKIFVVNYKVKDRVCGGMRGKMTKDVLITVSGLQFETEEDEAVEVISRGEYFFQNGKHFLVYNEPTSEDENSKCVIKISEKAVEVSKKGAVNVHMLFEKDVSNMTYYTTPVGDILIEITTHEIIWEENPDRMFLRLTYALDMNYQHVSECELTIQIDSVKAA